MPTLRRFPLAIATVAAILTPGAASDSEGADNLLTFERDVRPILKANCFHCHGEQGKPKGKLDVRLARLLLEGGDSGEAVVPGHHEESLLWEKVDLEEMPPGEKKLSAEERATIAAWIDQGARTARPEPEPETLSAGMIVTEEERAFWSFQPIRRPEVPAVGPADRAITPIDAFLLERLEAKGLGFSPEADRRTLIRRLAFDLHGLPPTPEEVDAFLADDAPGAYERLVDKLLASPRYGERWGRHWLDIAGYADSDGYTAKDFERKYAYKYRDYLIRALNADRPWDELIREQLAGDEMVGPIGGEKDLTPEDVEKLAATGFLRMAPDGTGDPTAEAVSARNDVVAETVKVVSTSLLGLTVGCAQCHDHRYDPISHEDYFRFRALFEPALDPKDWRKPNDRLVSLWTRDQRKLAGEVDAEVKQIEAERKAAIEELIAKVLDKEIAEAPEELRDALREARATPAAKRNPEQVALMKAYPRINQLSPGSVYLYDGKAQRAIASAFDARVAEAKKRRPAEDYVMALTEVPGKVPTTHLFDRGDHQQPRQAVEPGELTILDSAEGTAEIPVDDPELPTTGRRLAYARHLTSGRHPLVARVLVNRVWMHHFGRGLVETPADFGMLGSRPTHPELLDWLADDFMRGGWTLKRVHRMILNSTAYRQSSRRSDAIDEVDPENRLLGRMSVRRLEAEAIRDAILAASGRANPKMFGPPVPVAPDTSGQVILAVDTRDGAGRPTAKKVALGGEEYRRSLYIQARRSLPYGPLEVFDAPAMAPNCERRASSTVAPQALLLMNNDFVVEESLAFAERVAKDAGADPADRVRLAWRIALGAEPEPEQVASALEFLSGQEAEFAESAAPDEPGKKKTPDPAKPAPDRLALASLCQALFGSNAFLYVD